VLGEVFPFQLHSTVAPYSSLSQYNSYLKDKRKKTANLQANKTPLGYGGELDIKTFLCCYFYGTTGKTLKTRTRLSIKFKG
jgi:hypothetical protein